VAGPGTLVLPVLAASLNPLDVLISQGGFASRRPRPPSVLGFEGVGELTGGDWVYFNGPPLPYGSLAEPTLVDVDRLLPVPSDLDPALAAALGVAGLAAWPALEYRARLQAGETVLVLGAGGAVTQLAVQAAKILGAGHVVAATRTDAADELLLAHGAWRRRRRPARPRTVPAVPPRRLPVRYDVIVDLVWGEAVGQAIGAANMHARLVQVGNSATATTTVSAPAFRNRTMSLIGHTIFHTPHHVLRAAYDRLTQLALQGRLTLPTHNTRLADFSDAWEQLKHGHRHAKLTVTPY
jgi:NADPH:quinone reductase-like Zn-dependent oxidoreductase